MKIFHRIRDVLLRVGIYASQFNERFERLSWKCLLLIAHISVVSIFVVIFFFCEAETLNEYSDSVYGITTSSFVALNIFIMSWKTSVIYQLIENFESVIQTRKY